MIDATGPQGQSRLGAERRRSSAGRRSTDGDDQPALSGRVLNKGRLRLDNDKKRVYVGEQVVPLSRKEYLLLFCLMRHEGVVLSCRELADMLWPDKPRDFIDAKEYEVKQFVYTLRHKLQSCSGDPGWIQSVRGFGYTLICE